MLSMQGYLDHIGASLQTDYTEGTFYPHLQSLFSRCFTNDHGVGLGINHCTIQSQMSQGGQFPDFVIYSQGGEVLTRIEAKRPEVDLEACLAANQEQLRRYLNQQTGHPNLILTNFLSFGFVQVEDEHVVFSGGIHPLIGIDEIMDGLQNEQIAGATDRFREMLVRLAALEPSDVNAITNTRRNLAMLSHAVSDLFEEEAYEAPDNSDEQNEVVRTELQNLRNHTQSYLQNDGRRFGQLVVMGLCMNEFIRRREGTEEWAGLHGQLLPQLGLNQALTNLYHSRQILGIDQLIQNAQRGLSIHFPNIVEGNQIEDLETNSQNFEQFVFDYLRMENASWINSFGTVPTPIPIVRYMVRKAEQEYIHRSGNADGLLDQNCIVLDPCTGSGHYYIHTINQIYQSALLSNGEQYAIEQLRLAIGTEDSPGRIIAMDLQPSCILMTLMNLRLFCERHQIDIHELRPRIYLANALTYGTLVTDPEHLRNLRQQDISIVIGNPPWSGHESEQMTDALTECVRPWTTVYRNWYQAHINRHCKVAPTNPAYVFVQHFTSNANFLVTCFIVPSGICTSVQWLGARLSFMDRRYRVRIDHLGGEVGIIDRNDGDPVFVNDAGEVGTTLASSVLTFVRPVHEDTESNIRVRNCWNQETRWTTQQKWNALDEEAEMIHAEDELQLLPDENLYIDDFSAPRPPFHFWSSVSDGFDGPMLGLVACFDQNVSGMEPTSGCGYRLVDANLNAFQHRMQEFFQHATLDDAIDSVNDTWISQNFAGDHDQRNERYELVRGMDHMIQSSFRQISMGPMLNLHAFTPIIVDEKQRDQVMMWYVLKVNSRQLPEDVPDSLINNVEQGYFLIPNALQNETTEGTLASHIPYHPGHKHTAYNGRSFPRMYRVDEAWRANVSPIFRAFMDETCAEWDGYIEWRQNEALLARFVWDYALGIYAAEDMMRAMQPPNVCYNTNLVLVSDQVLFHRIRILGETFRLLQSYQDIPDESPFRELYTSVRALVNQSTQLVNARVEDDPEVVNLNQFEIFGQKQNGKYTARVRFEGITGIIEGSPLFQVTQDVVGHRTAVYEGFGLQVGENPPDIFAQSQVRISNQGGHNQWLRGVPTIATDARIAGHVVLQRWLTWNSNSEGQLHSTWDANHRLPKYRELTRLIRNLTVIRLLQPMANALFSQAVGNAASWTAFNPSLYEEE